MLESLTPFDAIAFTLILVSAIMALARGFMRELATLSAFIAALASAYVAIHLFDDQVKNWLPDGAAFWLPYALIGIPAFISAYALVAVFGQRLSKSIQGLEGIGLMDRIVGFAFGAARGFGVIMLGIIAMHFLMEDSRIPDFIRDARTYPYFKSSADLVILNAMKAAREAKENQAEADQPLPLEDEKVQ